MKRLLLNLACCATQTLPKIHAPAASGCFSGARLCEPQQLPATHTSHFNSSRLKGVAQARQIRRSLSFCLELVLLLTTLVVVAARAAVRDGESGQGMIESFLKVEARQLDAGFLDGITNRAQWEARRPELRQQYFEMLGLWPLPERTPLHATVTGTLERPEGFRVENVHFQSRPGLYVTGNFYLPKETPAGSKLPAVLYVCGHSGRGRDGNKTAFQHHGMWFATHGYACLVIDTLQLGEIAAIHHGTYRENRWWWQSRGYTPAAVECWNGIRALDYLQSRPEVDPERLAVTGISGGGAASFWIAAADERIKVAVPVSGLSDLEDYVGAKVVNGHCDCMFLINTFQWSWMQIAALVAPRPMLFANSGHDTIFPMPGNERIRARLERLYGFYTNRTDRLFDIAVTPGGHDDKPELRLMAYRWLNHYLKADDGPVTEPDLPKIEARLLRAFPTELPADQLNTKIDELFVPQATNALPQSAREFSFWSAAKLTELRRIVFRDVRFAPFQAPLSTGWSGEAGDGKRKAKESGPKLPSRQRQTGTLLTEPGITIQWKYFPADRPRSGRKTWLVVLSEEDSLASKPAWLPQLPPEDATFVVAPRNGGAQRWKDPAPFYIRRSLPLLGRTVDGDRLVDVLATATHLLQAKGSDDQIKIIGRGAAGVIGAYAALLEPRLSEVVVVDPPVSHRTGPIFLNILRVIDVPEALGLLAPRPLTVVSPNPEAFDSTAGIYRAARGIFKIRILQ